MAGKFYFAWVGGAPIPAVSLNTTGDIWSGSFQTMGTVWGGSLAATGDILSDGVTVANLQPRTGLVTGGVYAVTGGGVPGPAVAAPALTNGQRYTILTAGSTDFTKIGASANTVGTVFTATGAGAGSGVATVEGGTVAGTSFTYFGGGEGILSQPSTVAQRVSLTLLAAGTSTVILADVSALEPGTEYGIAGSGIAPGASFTFSGDETITISHPATATGFVQLTITNPNGKNRITNIADVTGLEPGFTYEVFALGLPAGVEGIYGEMGKSPLWATATNVKRIAGSALALAASGYMLPGQFALSPDEDFELSFQEDGNLILYQFSTSAVLWQTGTAGLGATEVAMQEGDLTVYRGSTLLWQSGTYGFPGATLWIQNDGNLVIYADTGGSILLFADAAKSGRSVPLAISKGKTYPDGGSFEPSAHATDAQKPFDGVSGTGEAILSIEISHEEGNFPSLKVDILNPKIGLLAAGRNLWCWLSYGPSDSAVPLFHGRLIGIPENLQEEVVTLQFVARPNDYQAQKAALAESLKVRPFWDPIWIAQGEDNPDTVLEARSQSWHIDRVSLAVTVSDILVGEDGTLILTADDHLYDGLEVSYADTPLRRVAVSGLVSWTQTGTGSVDLTEKMVGAFRAVGSPYYYPIISSFTPGLFDDWPKPGANIGAGWSIDASASIEFASWAGAWLMPKAYLKPNYASATVVDAPGEWIGDGVGIVFRPAITQTIQVIDAWETWATLFVLSPYALNFVVTWSASRPRTETVTFVLDADVQPLLTDPGDTEVATINLSSTLVGERIDPGDLLPIGDLRRNSYFNTDRGAQSIEFLITLARAKLLARARAVHLKVVTTWDLAINLSCRQNVQVLDDRLPAGQAAGKVTMYVLSYSGDGGGRAEITLGCSVGYGGTVAPSAGAATYADDYIDGYYASTGETIDPGTGDVVYQSLDDLDVLDDDGVDLLNMTPSRVINSIGIEGGPIHQSFTLGGFPDYGGQPLAPPSGGPRVWREFWQAFGDVPAAGWAQYEPSTVLARDPTIVSLDLVPIGTQAFETNYALTVSALKVPQTIDTEAS